MAGGLPTQNPPVSPDWTNLHAIWWGGNGPFTVAAGRTQVFPTSGIFQAPPVRGAGIVRNQITFSFDLVSGTVSAVIGVSNPSEFNVPMRPYTGVSYPNPTINLTAGQRVMLIRVDIIDQSQMPRDIRDWQMNPGVNGGSGRNGFPSLSPNVTNRGNGNAVIQNVQIESFATLIG